MGYREIALDYYGGSSPIPTDTIIHYKFNNDLVDSSSIGNNGIGSGTYTFGTDRKGVANNCLSLTNGRIETTNVVDLSSTDKVSLSFWFKTAQTLPFGVLFNIGVLTASNSLYCDIGDVQVGRILLQDRFDTSTRQLFWSNFVCNPDTWIHCVLTTDRSLNASTQIKMFFNGVDQAPNIFASSDLNGNYSNLYKLVIGAMTGLSNPFIGLVDDFRIYGRILSQTEITNLYNE